MPHQNQATHKGIDVTAPEGIVIQKLVWFRSGGESSDRQWRDVLGVLKLQRNDPNHATGLPTRLKQSTAHWSSTNRNWPIRPRIASAVFMDRTRDQTLLALHFAGNP